MWSGTLHWIKVYCARTRKWHSCSFLQQVYPHPQGAAQWPGLGLPLVQGREVGPLCSPGSSLTVPSPQKAPGLCYSIFGVEITLEKKKNCKSVPLSCGPTVYFMQMKINAKYRRN